MIEDTTQRRLMSDLIETIRVYGSRSEQVRQAILRMDERYHDMALFVIMLWEHVEDERNKKQERHIHIMLLIVCGIVAFGSLWVLLTL